MRKSPLWFRRLLVGGVSTLTVGGLGFAGLLTAGAAGATSAFSITQLAGADRFGTAAVIAEKAFPSGAPTVVIASGANANLSDSLAASYLAAQENAGKGAPILLVNPTGAIPSSTVSALNLLKPTKIVIVGGTGAVGSDVETALANSYGAGNVTRVAGPNRFATADAVDSQTGLMTVGKTATPGGHPAGPVAIVADGLDQNLVDALGASPLAYAGPYPLFLVNGATGTLSSTDLAIMATDGIKNAVLVGGSAAIGSQVASDLTVAGITSEQEAGPDRSATSDTLAEFELDTANKFGFVNTSFDIASGDQGHLVDSLSGGPLGGAAKAPTLITDGVDSVGSVATFATTHNATEASATQFGGTDAVSATVATSITQAAKGQAGMTGLTAAPNLTTVGTPAASLTAGFSTVTVNFDKTAYLTGVGGFGIVYADATVTGGSTAATGVCTVTSPAKGTGSMAFTLRCPNDPTGSIVGPALTAAQISRVIDLPGTVTTTAGGANPNPEEATTGQNTMANFPDLTGVAIALKATATTDTITYTFNSLSAGQTPAPADFAYINFDGTTGTVAATTVAQSVSNANQVVATYPVGTLSNAVAGIVKAGAVSNDAGAMNLDNEMA